MENKKQKLLLTRLKDAINPLDKNIVKEINFVQHKRRKKKKKEKKK